MFESRHHTASNLGQVEQIRVHFTCARSDIVPVSLAQALSNGNNEAFCRNSMDQQVDRTESHKRESLQTPKFPM